MVFKHNIKKQISSTEMKVPFTSQTSNIKVVTKGVLHKKNKNILIIRFQRFSSPCYLN